MKCSFCGNKKKTKLIMIKRKFYEFCKSCGNDPKNSIINSTGKATTMTKILEDFPHLEMSKYIY